VTAPSTGRREPTSDIQVTCAIGAFSILTLFAGGEIVSSAAVARSSQPVIMEGTIGTGGMADYTRAFEYTVAPIRRDVSATIGRIVFNTRDLVPLPWGKAYA